VVLVDGFSPLSLFAMVMFEGRPFARLCALNQDRPAKSTALVANSALFQLTFMLATRSNVVSLVRCSNKTKGFTKNELTLRQQR